MQTLEIIGTLIGLVYLWLEYRASIWLWAAGIVMPAVYVFVYYDAGFYADMGINVYYLLADGFGWLMWLRRRSRPEATGLAEGAAPSDGAAVSEAAPLPEGAVLSAENAPAKNSTQTAARTRTITGERTIAPMPRGRWLPLGAITALAFGVILWVLLRFTDSNVPYGDSFTTALSIAGLWMLAQKYVEQWLVWIVVDAVCAGLYFYKGLYPTAGLYALYTVIAVFGYFEWRRLMARQRT